MPRNLPLPVTVNDILVVAVVEILDEAVGLLREIRDRLPEPASETAAGGPGTATESNVEELAVDAADEVADRAPKAGAVLVTEPAVKVAKLAAKKTTPKPVKES